MAVHSSALVIAGAGLVVAGVAFFVVARLAVRGRPAYLTAGRRTGRGLETAALVVLLAGGALSIYGWVF